MPTPFPGMDPYLERPDLWPDVHNRLIADVADALAAPLRPRYYVSVEQRTYLLQPEMPPFVTRPDVSVVERGGWSRGGVSGGMAVMDPAIEVEVLMLDEVTETYLEVREVGSDRVITVIELLSPTHKRPGKGREDYETKRLEVLSSATHLVEMDLLRAGQPIPLARPAPPSDYRILVSRACRRPRAMLYPFSVRQPIPSFAIPLQRGDEEPLLDTTTLLHDLYDRAGYDLRVDYTRSADPPLAEPDATWADGLLRDRALR